MALLSIRVNKPWSPYSQTLAIKWWPRSITYKGKQYPFCYVFKCSIPCTGVHNWAVRLLRPVFNLPHLGRSWPLGVKTLCLPLHSSKHKRLFIRGGEQSLRDKVHPWGPTNLPLLMYYRVARWFVFKPKIQIWVNFGGSCSGWCWYILRTLGPFYGFLLYIMEIWYIVPVLVFCTKKNLATLMY
jgi:hypothetical protein